MGVVLLDTTVASFLHPKKKGSELRQKYAEHMRGQTLALSFQTVAELWNWAEANQWGESARAGLDQFIRRFLVIPYDYELAQVWARVLETSKKEGRRFEAGDCWIAATAVHRGIELLSHDGDFVGRSIPGLTVISYLEPNS
jgi:tRNA(fMet)-specific endonuclease VapC